MKNLFKHLSIIFLTILSIACNDEEDTPKNLLSISAPFTEVSEGDSLVIFTISLSSVNDTGQNLNIQYATSGNANNNTDFKALKGTVVLEPDKKETTVELFLLDDNEKENDEVFAISLSNRNLPSEIGLSENTFVITILDND